MALAVHSKDVGNRARQFAVQLGLPAAVVEDIALAAFLHDAGKAHRSFQVWLHGGDELAAVRGGTLAKSGRAVLGSAARARSGLPSRARHEVASLAGTFVVFVYFMIVGGQLVVPIVAVISALIFWKHRENIQRLFSGQESRIGAKG